LLKRAEIRSWICALIRTLCISRLRGRPVISVTEVNLTRVPRALEGEVKGGSSLEGAGKGRLWRKGSRKGID
jgi:hypothetical protein